MKARNSSESGAPSVFTTYLDLIVLLQVCLVAVFTACTTGSLVAPPRKAGVRAIGRAAETRLKTALQAVERATAREEAAVTARAAPADRELARTAWTAAIALECGRKRSESAFGKDHLNLALTR